MLGLEESQSLAFPFLVFLYLRLRVCIFIQLHQLFRRPALIDRISPAVPFFFSGLGINDYTNFRKNLPRLYQPPFVFEFRNFKSIWRKQPQKNISAALNQKNRPPLYRNQVIQLGNVYFMEASANYVLLCTVYGMFGGLTCFFIGWSLYIIKFVPTINILQEVIQSNALIKLTFPFGVLFDARMV